VLDFLAEGENQDEEDVALEKKNEEDNIAVQDDQAKVSSSTTVAVVESASMGFGVQASSSTTGQDRAPLGRLDNGRPPLNPEEQGEDEDEADDVVEVEEEGKRGSLRRAASDSSIAGALAVARRRIPSHLRVPKRKAKLRRLPSPSQIQEWDDRHQLAGVENELLPKKLRAYFSRPQSLPELREDLLQRKHVAANVEWLDRDEVPPTYPTPITADSGPPAIPTKHVFGGHMRGRDNEIRPWNDRWSQGIGVLNDGMHPSHRQYFSQDSLFAEAPSQRWRRFQDVEVSRDYSKGTARWKPNQEKRPSRFPPIGF
jgi:hypothetical protein